MPTLIQRVIFVNTGIIASYSDELKEVRDAVERTDPLFLKVVWKYRRIHI